ncbi:MAG: XdhC family protein [Gemmatimonadaceae bacterium]|nr:XdhC family protein [Gemmatimonadaceae bacterium]
MKQWLETRQVFAHLARVHADGARAALATVVRVHGSAYRHEGARLLVTAAGDSTGNVSGGCLEADVREVGQRVISTGMPELRSYCGGSDEVAAWDLGVGCDGEVEILIEPVASPRLHERHALAAEEPYVAVTLLRAAREYGESPRLVLSRAGRFGTLGDAALDQQVAAHADGWRDAGESRTVALGDARLFVDVLIPPPRLVVVSAGDDARILARMAAEVGFRVVVVDRRPGLLTRERFPDTIRLLESDAATLTERLVLDAASSAVVMTHDYADDTAYLGALLGTPARYLGMLGPRQRTDRILARLSAAAPVDLSRIYGPVGLDIGTDGAEQVALAVLAELLAVRSGRQPQSLRDRRAPIHATGE